MDQNKFFSSSFTFDIKAGLPGHLGPIPELGEYITLSEKV